MIITREVRKELSHGIRRFTKECWYSFGLISPKKYSLTSVGESLMLVKSRGVKATDCDRGRFGKKDHELRSCEKNVGCEGKETFLKADFK